MFGGDGGVGVCFGVDIGGGDDHVGWWRLRMVVFLLFAIGDPERKYKVEVKWTDAAGPLVCFSVSLSTDIVLLKGSAISLPHSTTVHSLQTDKTDKTATTASQDL